MKTTNIVLSLILCMAIILSVSITAFADAPSSASIQSNSEYPYNLYDGKIVTLQNHTEVVVRQSAGGTKWPSNNTLYLGYILTVDDANCNYVNGLWWSQITPDNNSNPGYVNSGYSASYLLN